MIGCLHTIIGTPALKLWKAASTFQRGGLPSRNGRRNGSAQSNAISFSSYGNDPNWITSQRRKKRPISFISDVTSGEFQGRRLSSTQATAYCRYGLTMKPYQSRSRLALSTSIMTGPASRGSFSRNSGISEPTQGSSTPPR